MTSITKAAGRLSYEYPGVIVLTDAHGRGDVGINLDSPDEREQWHVIAYPHGWHDPDAEDGLSAFMPVRGEDEREVEIHARNIATYWFREQDGNPMILLSDASCVLVTEGHVFLYPSYGDECIGIIHRRDFDPAECQALGCRAELVTPTI